MPASKKRLKTRKRSVRPARRRDMTRQAQARETQAAQAKAANVKKQTPGAYRRRRILGWTFAGLAIIVFVTHLMEHLGFFAFASPGVEDLVAGYPLAAVLAITAAIILGK